MVAKVLENLKVVGFTAAGVGNIVMKTMAEQGATCVRIESILRPCILRTAQPFKDGKPGVNRSAYFAIYNNGLLSISLNMKHEKTSQITKRLFEWADVVIENYSPGTMASWGIDYEQAKKIKPDIIMISLSHQGQTGPHRGIPGYGSQLQGVAGLANLTGYPDRMPSLIGMSYPDFITPPFGVTAIVAALDYKRRTGKGQYIDVSEFEDTLMYLQPVLLDYQVNKRVWMRNANKVPSAAPHGAFCCKGDDQWCAIAVTTDKQWQAFCTIMGDPDWTKSSKFVTLRARKQNEDDLNKLVNQWTINYTPREVMDKLQTVGVPAGMFQNSGDVVQDPHLKARGYFQILNHPEIGPHEYVRSNFILAKTPGELKRPAPLLGEHTEYVCRELLHVPSEEFDQLLVEEVFQ